MTKKQPQIFKLNTDPPEIQKLQEVNSLMMDGNYKKVIEEGKKAISKYPNNSLFYISVSIGYSQIGNTKEAFRVLKQAEKKFPSDYEVLFQLAKVYEDKSEFNNAEICYKKSYKYTPKDKTQSRSDCLNDLGVLYWNQHRKFEALEQWKLAVAENPKDKKAKRNLKDFTNEYGEPAAVSPLMDDVFHFQKIQTEKYFKSHKKNNFSTKEEADKIIGIISTVWNQQIAPDKDKIDRLPAKDKSQWFENVKIDFSKTKPMKMQDMNQGDLNFADDEFPENIILDEREIVNTLNEINDAVDYLPPYSILLLPFLSPLLVKAGLKQKRVEEILEKNNPREEELEILQWAVEIGDIMIEIVETKKLKEKEILREEAVEVAADYVPRTKSGKVLSEIEVVFKEISRLSKSFKDDKSSFDKPN